MPIVANQDSRNANWSKGSIGSKLLSKMGWTEGTGLGKHRSGTSVPLRAVRQSAEAAGIGSKASDADGSQGWNRTTDGYASVLQSLQAQHGTGRVATSNAAGESLTADGPKKSKKKKKKLVLAQNRVTAGHSRKLREAKDLSTKSQADMAAIFGGVPQAIAAQTIAGKKKKKRKREPTPPVEVEAEEDEVEDVVVSKEDQKKAKKSKKKSKKSDTDMEKPPKKKRKKDKK
jgi:hypothetical protein